MWGKGHRGTGPLVPYQHPAQQQHLHRRSICLRAPARAGVLPLPKGRLLPNDFFAILRDRTQMLWRLKTIFHVPLSKMINKATRSSLYPVLTRNMQFLLTAFKGPAVNSAKRNGCRDNIFLKVMLRSHVRWRFMTNMLTMQGTCLQEEDTPNCGCFIAE